ncbi:hypothetical protein DTO212C5_4414 [Paecilomyces variotii]|nr:hypothetical protein DTO212C5_4414 [Paecilomyces variotii]
MRLVVDVILLMLTSGTLASDTLTLVGRVGETVRRLWGSDTLVVDGVSLVAVDEDGLVSDELLVRSGILSVLVDVDVEPLLRTEESSGSTVREALLDVAAPAARLDACRREIFQRFDHPVESITHALQEIINALGAAYFIRVDGEDEDERLIVLVGVVRIEEARFCLI